MGHYSSRKVGMGRRLYDLMQLGDPWFDRLAERVRSARLVSGMPAGKVADELGLGEQVYYGIEKNKVPLKLIQLRAISNLFSIPVHQFFEGIDRDSDNDLIPLPRGDDSPLVWRITARDELKLIEVWRRLKRKEKKIILLMCKAIMRARSPRVYTDEELAAMKTRRQIVKQLQREGFEVKPKKPTDANRKGLATMDIEVGPRGDRPAPPLPKREEPPPEDEEYPDLT